MTDEVPVDVSSPSATLQSAMNAYLREIENNDPQELTGDELLRIAQVQALIEIAEEIRTARRYRTGLPEVFG